MNAGLLNKSVREAFAVIAVCCIGIMVFEALMSYIFWSYQDEFAISIGSIEFIQDFINSMVGGRAGGAIGPGTLSSLAWVHPLVLSIVFALEITLCTRVPAGEIDRGTIDVLLALPVSRWAVYTAETVVWLGAGLALVSFAYLGSTLGYLWVPAEDRPEAQRIVFILVNLYCLYLSVGALSLMASALSDRRGRAIGIIFAVVLTLFLWNFLGQYFEPLDRVSFLNVFSYYKPMPILNDGTFPLRDTLVLLGCAVPLWISGGVIFSRRDICTV